MVHPKHLANSRRIALVSPRCRGRTFIWALLMQRHMVEVGDDAPDFALHDGERNIVTGSEFRGQRVVLAFFPAAFTGVCKDELCTFQGSLARLNAANATVLAISVDAQVEESSFGSLVAACGQLERVQWTRDRACVRDSNHD